MVLIIVLLLDNEMLTSRCDGAVFGAEGPGFESCGDLLDPGPGGKKHKDITGSCSLD